MLVIVASNGPSPSPWVCSKHVVIARTMPALSRVSVVREGTSSESDLFAYFEESASRIVAISVFILAAFIMRILVQVTQTVRLCDIVIQAQSLASKRVGFGETTRCSHCTRRVLSVRVICSIVDFAVLPLFGW